MCELVGDALVGDCDGVGLGEGDAVLVGVGVVVWVGIVVSVCCDTYSVTVEPRLTELFLDGVWATTVPVG